jgi:DNA-binding NarL/FixJ family response regulator
LEQQLLSSIRILVVDDYEGWRRQVRSLLQSRSEWQVIAEAADGPEAIQKAEALKPDLIVLDIGLPSLNGIEVARQIRKLSPESKILFVSQESSADVVQEALSTGAHGYVVKTDARSELLEAVSAVLRRERFVGRRFSGHDFVGASEAMASEEFRIKSALALQRNIEVAHRHNVGFYSDDAGLLDDATQFIGAALTAGSSAVVVATEPHRNSLLLRLQGHGSDIAEAIEQGRYIAVDAADALSTFMIHGMLDPVRYLNLFRDVIVRAAKAAKGEQARVAVFGEGVHLLWAQGNAEAAIQVEGICNQLAKAYDVDILCGYSIRGVQGGMESPFYEKICAEHSAVYSR